MKKQLIRELWRLMISCHRAVGEEAMVSKSELQSNRFYSLLDLVKAVAKPLRFELGPSSGDDVSGSPLGPSIGDDTFGKPSRTLGPCLGDDQLSRIAPAANSAAGPMPEAAVLGACVGDDFTQTSVGPSVGDDASSRVNSIGPCVGDDETPSDRRLKTIIGCVGTTTYGLPVYRFNYLGRPGIFEGVMAQDVLKVMPSAVRRNAAGFYSVNYAMLGISMRQVS
jgi:hypothetical protein